MLEAKPDLYLRELHAEMKAWTEAGDYAAPMEDYATLLKDVGCSSNSARMCRIVGGDDRAVKAGAKLSDWTRPLRPQLSCFGNRFSHRLLS